MKTTICSAVLTLAVLLVTYPITASANCNIDTPGFTDYWIQPKTRGGNDSNDGSYGSPKATLKGVHDVLQQDLGENVVVHVMGGTYLPPTDAEINGPGYFIWTKTDPSYDIVIEACPGEIPIFTGKRSGNTHLATRSFRMVAENLHEKSNLTLRGLTFTEITEKAVAIGWGDNNLIEDCTFVSIGNKQDPEGLDGLGVINFEGSSGNTVRNNRFQFIENIPEGGTQSPGHRHLIHLVYIVSDSDDNIIELNSADRVSGNPIKLKSDSGDLDTDKTQNNIVRYNYFNRAGWDGIIHNGDAYPARNTMVYGNVFTFPYEISIASGLAPCSGNSCATEVDFYPTGEPLNFFWLDEPTAGGEEISAVLGGDFDQDGTDEVIAAFSYDGYSGFSKIVSTAGSTDNRYFHRVLYVNDDWNVSRMTAGDFDSDGDLELLTAFHALSQTSVYSGDGESRMTGASNHGLLYTDSTGSINRVYGMTSGDFDGDGDEEVLTDFQRSSYTSVKPGDGTTTLEGSPALLSDSSYPYWKVDAMTSGDFDSDGDDEVITAMHYGGTSPAYYVYSGNGTSSLQNSVFYPFPDVTVPYWAITASVGGDFDNDGTDELITGMYLPSSYKLYSGNGVSSVANSVLKTSSSPFFIRALGAADYNDDGDLDLLTAIESPDSSYEDLKIWIGNGATDYRDITELYSSYFNDSGCEDSAAASESFGQGQVMYGCAGSVLWTNSESLCAPGYSTCSAADWMSNRGAQAPSHNYWTSDDLRWGGGASACWVSDTLGTACNAPMRVCVPGGDDDVDGDGIQDNDCNWSNCGWESASPNGYFGGCYNDLTAGTLCCSDAGIPLRTGMGPTGSEELSPSELNATTDLGDGTEDASSTDGGCNVSTRGQPSPWLLIAFLVLGLLRRRQQA